MRLEINVREISNELNFNKRKYRKAKRQISFLEKLELIRKYNTKSQRKRTVCFWIFENAKSKIKDENLCKVRISYKERREDALVYGAEEGRDKLRKAVRSCT